MNVSHIIPIFVIILFGIVVLYRISLLLTGSTPRGTKIIRGIALAVGIIIALVLGGLQIFHIIH